MPVYQNLLSEVTDELERQVLDVLLEHAGERVNRGTLVLAVFHTYVEADQLAASTHDRMVRECIARLREKDWPIVSSSSEAGYTLETDEEQIKAFAAEQQSRAERNLATAKAAYRWLPKARAIREARLAGQTQAAAQPRLL
jgi:hypothetical protein